MNASRTVYDTTFIGKKGRWEFAFDASEYNRKAMVRQGNLSKGKDAAPFRGAESR